MSPTVPGHLHGIVLRSPHGHASIEGIDAVAAQRDARGSMAFSPPPISMPAVSGHCRASPGWRRLRR
jgi:hypothetical protein